MDPTVRTLGKNQGRHWACTWVIHMILENKDILLAKNEIKIKNTGYEK